LKFENYSC